MDKLSYCGSFLATPLSLEGVAGRKRRLFRAQRTGYGTKIGTTTATFLCIFDPCMFGRTCPSFPAVSAPLSGNNKNSPSAILARACKKSDIHAVHDRRVGMPTNQATGFDRNKITSPNFNDPHFDWFFWRPSACCTTVILLPNITLRTQTGIGFHLFPVWAETRCEEFRRSDDEKSSDKRVMHKHCGKSVYVGYDVKEHASLRLGQ